MLHTHHDDPIIMTLRMDGIAATHFTALRNRYFPPERNVLAAHITLFHKLPAAFGMQFIADAADLCAQTTAFAMHTDGLLFFGGGVAYRVASRDAQTIRRHLAERWRDHLSPQDQKPHFTPHITVQNKVTGDVAKALYRDLNTTFTPVAIRAIGLDLWRYRGGPWEPLAGFAFQDA